MIAKRLLNDIRPILKGADVVWIAMALVKDKAFKSFFKEVPPEASIKILIGTDLPTEPEALSSIKALQSDRFIAGLFQTSKTFHPKVYLIWHGLKMTAVIGSANMTLGAFNDNIELNFITEDQERCIEVQEWFTKLFETSALLNDENIEAYIKRYTHTKEIERIVRSSPRAKFNEPVKKDKLERIDFSNRYFKREHHSAFRSILWENRTPAAIRERRYAYDRFYELHELIFPLFSNYSFRGLDHNRNEQFTISHYEHRDGYTSKQLDSMWLSYGKNRDIIREYQKRYSPHYDDDSEKDNQSFINHARLQVIIWENGLGIWLFFAKANGGSEIDRNHFRKNMERVAYREEFFKRCKALLPGPYYISLGKGQDDSRNLLIFQNAEELHEYCKKDRSTNHFIIGRDYKIENAEASLAQFPNVVLSEFEKLFPLYDWMRDKQFG